MTDVVKNYLYGVLLYNGKPEDSKIVLMSSESFDHFGLKSMTDRYEPNQSDNRPKIGTEAGELALEPSGNHFIVPNERLRKDMYLCMVVGDPHSI